jgi:hypothetical protein
MSPFIRKFTLLAHIIFSVGWLGTLIAYLALAIGGLISRDIQTARAAYFWMEPIGWFVIVPLSFAATLSGVIQSVGTRWGLLQHWWIVVKFVLTLVGTVILLRHMKILSQVPQVSDGLFRPNFRPELIHAGGGLLLLVAVTTLSVFKPWGLTPWTRRYAPPARVSSTRASGGSLSNAPALAPSGTRWRLIAGVHAVLFVVLFAILHLSGMHHHR